MVISSCREMARALRISSCPLVSIFFFLLLHMLSGDVVDDATSITTTTTTSVLSRLDYPPEFVFGAGTSAYQVEGAAAEDGRKPSVWDTSAHDGGDIASDQYHKYKDDVKLMHKMGLDAYRFSISWSRLIPDGYGAINPKGLNYYNNLIDELVSYGIEAHVTLVHFDIPQALQDEYEGYLSVKFIGDFTAYADVCFKEYGDRVKSWSTFNEPNMQTALDSTTYLASHNILLSHAAAVNLYRSKYQEKQKGQIGITLLGFWFEPSTNSPQDIAASKRVLDFHLGWFLDPLVYGRYPAVMRKIIGARLPVFTEKDAKQLKSSFDFIGLNHYFVLHVQDLPRSSDMNGSDYSRDISVKPPFPDAFLGDTRPDSMTEWGLQKLLEYVKYKYRNPVVVIHENGYMTIGDGSFNPKTQNDTERTEYLQTYIQSLLPSIRNGSNVRGYFVWSFLDVFEVFGEYTNNFGLYGVDFTDKDRRRYPRQSAHWYSNFLAQTGKKTEPPPNYLYNE